MMSEGKVIGRVCKIKLWDKNNAQERLFKYLRLYDKDNSPEALAINNIEVSFVSGDGKRISMEDFRKRRQS